MNYPNYYPYQSYQGFYPGQYQNQTYQPRQDFTQYQQPQQNVPQGAMETVPVQTVQQVEQVSVLPGQRKIVMVQNDSVIAMRAADPTSGLVDTKYFRLEEFDPHAAAQTPTFAPNYVTTEQLEARLATFADSLKPVTSTQKKEAALE